VIAIPSTNHPSLVASVLGSIGLAYTRYLLRCIGPTQEVETTFQLERPFQADPAFHMPWNFGFGTKEYNSNLLVLNLNGIDD
jgi:hypothetical protein